MSRKLAGSVNIILGIAWFLVQSLLCMVLGGIEDFKYPRFFFKAFLFFVLYLGGPVCLVLGSYKVLRKPGSLFSIVLVSIGEASLWSFLAPSVYDGFHPAPLEYVDHMLTCGLLVVITLTTIATCYLVADFIHIRKKLVKD